MHRIIPVILLVTMLLCSLTACNSDSNQTLSASPTTAPTKTKLDAAGFANLTNGETQAYLYQNIPAEEFKSLLEEDYRVVMPDYNIKDLIYVDSLTDGLLMLRSGKTDMLFVMSFTGDFLMQRSDDLAFYTDDEWISSTHMLFKPEMQKQYEKVNSAIKSMNEDGTMKGLVEKWITNLPVGGEIAGGELPQFAGADTIKIGVSGDEPPLDYISADGKPGGFNTAMLIEVANRARVNFAMVNITSGSRFAAMESGKVDAFLWHNGDVSDHGVKAPAISVLEIGDSHFLMTDNYLEATDNGIRLKK